MKKRQQGLTTVEAAIGAALMLIVLFGAIEIARAIFVWNYLDGVTRRGARVAAVCPYKDPVVKEAALFFDEHVKGLTKDYVQVEYLKEDGSDSTGFEDTRFVRVSIENGAGNNFEVPLLFFNTISWTTPKFRTVLPSESLGYNPDDGSFGCVFP